MALRALRSGKNKVSSRGLIDHGEQFAAVTVCDDVRATSSFIDGPRETELLIGNGALRHHLGEILELRRRCGQEDDLTTEPEYFMAANTLANRRCSAVLIRRDRKLEACVLFYEHTRLGIGIGLFRGGDYIGESLVVGWEPLKATYVHLATQALLKKWRIHGVSLTLKAPADRCIEIMGPASDFRRFRSSEVQHKLPLESTYERMLGRLGPRTRRSLAGKRQQLEKSANVKFVAVLDPDKSLEVMLELESKSMPQRVCAFFHARHRLLRANSDFFSMGLQLPGGLWLSLLSGWRRHGVTYVDLQMNDMHYKKESISAVMRAFLLENEIACRQQMINFVGGSSLLLRRYCEPLEPCTDFFVAKPGIRSDFFEMLARHMRSGSVYERLKCGCDSQLPVEAGDSSDQG
jgi:hypothetical protein